MRESTGLHLTRSAHRIRSRATPLSPAPGERRGGCHPKFRRAYTRAGRPGGCTGGRPDVSSVMLLPPGMRKKRRSSGLLWTFLRAANLPGGIAFWIAGAREERTESAFLERHGPAALVACQMEFSVPSFPARSWDLIGLHTDLGRFSDPRISTSVARVRIGLNILLQDTILMRCASVRPIAKSSIARHIVRSRSVSRFHP